MNHSLKIANELYPLIYRVPRRHKIISDKIITLLFVTVVSDIMCQIILILDTVEVGAVHPLYGSSKGSFYQSGSNLQESNLKAMDTSNIPTLEERFATRL